MGAQWRRKAAVTVAEWVANGLDLPRASCERAGHRDDASRAGLRSAIRDERGDDHTARVELASACGRPVPLRSCCHMTAIQERRIEGEAGKTSPGPKARGRRTRRCTSGGPAQTPGGRESRVAKVRGLRGFYRWQVDRERVDRCGCTTVIIYSGPDGRQQRVPPHAAWRVPPGLRMEGS